MKKIILFLIAAFMVTSVYAEGAKMFGLTFGMSKADVRKFDVDKNVETPMENALKGYARDIEVECFFDRNDKLNEIEIATRFGKEVGMLQAYWMAYFMENLNCNHVENVYYNDDIVATIIHEEDGAIKIRIGNKKEFTDIINSLNK